MTNIQEFTTKEVPQWCPGCGNFIILAAVKSALSQLNLETHNTVVVSGIGCSGKDSHFFRTYGFEGIHGRVLPVATGVKLSNRKLTVLGMGGDGDAYGIGLNHFIHACRRNLDITYIVHNNEIYGLTTGQVSPTSMKGMKTKSTPHGVIEQPIHPLALAIASDATFVARGYSSNMPHLTKIVAEAIEHKGFSLIDIFQLCPSWNKVNTAEWFKDRLYDINEAGHDTSDKKKAFEKALEDVNTNYEKVPIGIFYKEERATYGDELPQIKEKELINHEIENIDMSKTLARFK
ncbi:2-oxoacid:ferredoxin oxidoreductase subunit beta [Candidatus Micrarchaeota archaeon]|nr:2-oxoacid:ferredoxin oxidoreductase subunit beta [Candidatus Micrarchaeota archaeon]